MASANGFGRSQAIEGGRRVTLMIGGKTSSAWAPTFTEAFRLTEAMSTWTGEAYLKEARRDATD